MTALAKTTGGGWLAAPQNMSEVYAFAKTVAASDLAPKDYRGKPDNVLVAIQLGSEVGLSPMQALQNIAVINGRPSIWGDAQLALVRAHPSVLGYSESWDDKTQTWTCTLRRMSRDGQVETTVGEFSMADAIKARLANKQGPWSEYPKRMIKMRARSWCLRDGAADILKGLAQGEEAQDMEPVRASVVAEPPRTALPAQSSEPQREESSSGKLEAPKLPTRTSKNYAVTALRDKPFTELSDGELTEYLAYYTEKKGSPVFQGLHAAHQAAVDATIAAAELELERRIQEEGQPLDNDNAADPFEEPAAEPAAALGEMVEYIDPDGVVRQVPADSLEGQLALSLAAKGIDRTDESEPWGLSDGMPTKAKAEKRATRKGAA